MLDPAQLLDPAALAIVAGGTAMSAALRTPVRDLAAAARGAAALMRAPFRAEPLAEQVAALSRIARRHGTFQLDRSVIADPDVAAAVAAVVDGAGADEVSALLCDLRDRRAERHRAAAEVWAGAAEVAPAMGMVGTLVGLAQVFAAMTDPAAIGGAMAVALLATLYGALLSNLVLAPVAARLREASRAEWFERARLEAPLRRLAERETPHPRVRAAA